MRNELNANWPNPERPGAPLFPERKAWHMLDRGVWEWCPSRQAWNDTVLHPSFVKAKDMAWRKYHGPVLTCAQIEQQEETIKALQDDLSEALAQIAELTS